MSEIFKGRYTAITDQPFVVFLIGMRANKWWRLDRWMPVASAMEPMLKTLYAHPEKGFLHAEFFWNLNGPILIQYWRSFEDLERFARPPLTRTSARGEGSTRRSERMGVWGSGTRLIL